ncbi:hypothetical protein D3C86_1648340 [compost metagenome]
MIGQRRQELVQQVAVRAVQLDAVDAEPRGALGCGDEIVTNLAHAGLVQRQGRHFVRAMRHCRRRHGLPAARLVRADLRTALPGRLARRLAARVRKLHAHRNGGILAHRVQHAAQRGLVGIAVQAEVVRRDAALGRHRRGLDDQQPGTRERHVAQVNHVPVGSRALVGRVLAHRRNGDAVGKFEITDLVGREKLGHEQVPSEAFRRRRVSRCWRL